MRKTAPVVRWWDLPAAIILITAIFLASLRLAATRWTEELSIVHVVVLTGVIAGLVLGHSLFTHKHVIALAAAYGAFVIGWQLAATFGGFSTLWLDRVETVATRLSFSLENLALGSSVTDPIFFLILMMVLFWGLSTYAGYSLTRHASPWRAVLPTGFALFVIQIYDPYWPIRIWYLAGFAFLALLLLSRLTFVQKHREWQRSRIHLPPYIGLDFLRATMLAGLVITLLAWTAPAFAATVSPIRQMWSRIAQPMYEARDNMSNAFAALNSNVRVVQDYYGSTLPLGRGNTLSDEIILTAYAEEQNITAAPFYWRARSYDHFNGRNWSVTVTESEVIRPGDIAINLLNTEGRVQAAFSIAPGIPMLTLFTTAQPIWISRQANIEYFQNRDGTADLLAIKAQQAVYPGETFEFIAQVPDATVADLRQAGTVYPDWVRERYLRMPASTTDRTLELAAQIASGKDNPYDIAVAVTNYLRTNIRYSDSLPPLPAEQNLVDWLLFDHKEGYCNYYAAAQIVLLRSLGIPARLAVGYAQGEYDAANNTYTVRQHDAHAWPEVFFPGIGWIDFEPTASQSSIIRPSGNPAPNNDPLTPEFPEDELLTEADLLAQDPANTAEEILPGGGNNPEGDSATAVAQPSLIETMLPRLLAILPVLAVLFAAVLGYIWYEQQGRAIIRRVKIVPISIMVERGFLRFGIHPPRFIQEWAYKARLPIQARGYEQINRSLRRLGNAPGQSLTPAERGSQLVNILPEGIEDITILLREYQPLVYGAESGEAEIALVASRSLWITTWKAYLKTLIPRLPGTTWEVNRAS